MGQLRDVQRQLIEAGYQILAFSADSPEKVRAMVEKTPYDYTLLSDSTMQAATQLGLAYRVSDKTVERLRGYGINLDEASGMDHYLLPVPAVFVLDTAGTVRFRYFNPDYKVRLEAERLLAEARAALEGATGDPGQPLVD